MHQLFNSVVSSLNNISHKPMTVLMEMLELGHFREKKIENFRENILANLHDICAQAYASLGVTNQRGRNNFQKTLHIPTNFVTFSVINANVVGSNIKLNFRPEEKRIHE